MMRELVGEHEEKNSGMTPESQANLDQEQREPGGEDVEGET